MARQDIAGLLTGMPQQQRPNPNMSSAEWRLAFGQQQSDNMARGLQGAVGGLMGTGMAGAASPQEQIQIADLKAQERIGKLATSQDPAELRQAAQLLQQRGKSADAARVLAQAKAIEDKEKATQSMQERQQNFIPFLEAEHPNLVSLAQGNNPVVTPENYQNYLAKSETLTTDQKNWMLARKQGDKRDFTTWKDRNVKEASGLTPETKNYRIAVEQGFTGTQLEYSDRNVKIGGANLTGEQKNLRQINEERLKQGEDVILLEDYLDKKQKKGSNYSAKYQLYKDAVDGGYVGDYLDFAQAEAEAIRAPSAANKARPTAKGKDGFLRYTDGTKELVYPEVRAKAIEDARVLQETATAKKESTIEYLEKIGMTTLAERVRANIVTPDDAMTESNVPPEITKLANGHLEKSMEFGGQSKNALSLLLRYNEIAPASGSPAAIAREVAAKFGKGGAERLLSFTYGEGRIAASNILLPPGTATEMEVRRSDATQPTLEESPEVVRGYLYGKAKKNALAAAQFAALQKHIINFNGNTSTFLEIYQDKINDKAYVQRIFDDAGIPPSANFKPKKISGRAI
tara:strand:+ start:326 stop:2041 length:1716 start_codon:yes stop_codon:yes gene_type:complete